MENATLGFRIYKIWQILKHYSRQLIWSHILIFWRVSAYKNSYYINIFQQISHVRLFPNYIPPETLEFWKIWGMWISCDWSLRYCIRSNWLRPRPLNFSESMEEILWSRYFTKYVARAVQMWKNYIICK